MPMHVVRMSTCTYTPKLGSGSSGATAHRIARDPSASVNGPWLVGREHAYSSPDVGHVDVAHGLATVMRWLGIH